MVYSPNSAKVLMIITLATTLAFLCSSSSLPKTDYFSPNFYNSTCPGLLKIVQEVVDKYVKNESRMGASLLRMHFHDCFITGCDGSILLKGKHSEQVAAANHNSIRGYEVIDAIKEAVEQTCKNVVSCADILALAARESVVYLGGPRWGLDFGRRDSKLSSKDDVNSSIIPSPLDGLDLLASKFKNQGFSIAEMVALSGAHTIGQAQCINFRDRIYKEKTIDTGFAINAQKQCPFTNGGGGDQILQPLDIQTPKTFDNSYYRDLITQQGLLHSDQQLFNPSVPGPKLNSLSFNATKFVKKYWRDQNKFRFDFGVAMMKMSRLSPLLGNRGEIRKTCSLPNKRSIL